MPSSALSTGHFSRQDYVSVAKISLLPPLDYVLLSCQDHVCSRAWISACNMETQDALLSDDWINQFLTDNPLGIQEVLPETPMDPDNGGVFSAAENNASGEISAASGTHPISPALPNDARHPTGSSEPHQVLNARSDLFVTDDSNPFYAEDANIFTIGPFYDAPKQYGITDEQVAASGSCKARELTAPGSLRIG